MVLHWGVHPCSPPPQPCLHWTHKACGTQRCEPLASRPTLQAQASVPVSQHGRCTLSILLLRPWGQWLFAWPARLLDSQKAPTDLWLRFGPAFPQLLPLRGSGSGAWSSAVSCMHPANVPSALHTQPVHGRHGIALVYPALSNGSESLLAVSRVPTCTLCYPSPGYPFISHAGEADDLGTAWVKTRREEKRDWRGPRLRFEGRPQQRSHFTTGQQGSQAGQPSHRPQDPGLDLSPCTLGYRLRDSCLDQGCGPMHFPTFV